MILSVIIIPVVALVELIILRLICELLVVLLLLPFYSRNSGGNDSIIRVENLDSENMDVSVHSKIGDRARLV